MITVIGGSVTMKNEYVFTFVADDVSDLVVMTEVTDNDVSYPISAGTTAIVANTGDRYMRDSTGAWHQIS